MIMHSLDIYQDSDIGSRNLLQQKKILKNPKKSEKIGHLCLLFYVIWNEKRFYISIPSCKPV